MKYVMPIHRPHVETIMRRNVLGNSLYQPEVSYLEQAREDDPERYDALYAKVKREADEQQDN